MSAAGAPPQERVAPARRAALGVLARVEGGAYADRALGGEAARARLDPRDRRLAQALAYGAVQRRRTLDWILQPHVRDPRALEPRVRDILRLGTLELCLMEARAPHAVVDEAVRAARALPGAPARRRARAGLVNAVLRRVAEDRGRGSLAALSDADPAGAAILHSVPDALAVELFASLGAADARAVLARANLPAESAVRWNPLRGPRAPLERELPPGWRRDQRLPEAYVLAAPVAFEATRAWARGLAMPQSRSSMLPARALDPRPGERVLDLCAAPGAKATHLAALAGNRAELTAVERNPARAESLRALARRMGARLEVVVGDARDVPLSGPYDAVLVDAPCSGLGVLASRPDIRWRERDPGALAALQHALCRRALALARPGGRVVYATCTLAAAENEEVVAGLGAPLDDLTALLPEAAHPRLPGALLALPHRTGSDGFFVVRMRAA